MEELWRRLSMLKSNEDEVMVSLNTVSSGGKDISSGGGFNDVQDDEVEMARILASIEALENLDTETREKQYIESLVGGNFKLDLKKEESGAAVDDDDDDDDESTARLLSNANKFLSKFDESVKTSLPSEEIDGFVEISANNIGTASESAVLLGDMGNNYEDEEEDEVAAILRQANDEAKLNILYRHPDISSSDLSIPSTTHLSSNHFVLNTTSFGGGDVVDQNHNDYDNDKDDSHSSDDSKSDVSHRSSDSD
jgi:hypothetical protein